MNLQDRRREQLSRCNLPTDRGAGPTHPFRHRLQGELVYRPGKVADGAGGSVSVRSTASRRIGPRIGSSLRPDAVGDRGDRHARGAKLVGTINEDGRGGGDEDAEHFTPWSGPSPNRTRLSRRADRSIRYGHGTGPTARKRRGSRPQAFRVQMLTDACPRWRPFYGSHTVSAVKPDDPTQVPKRLECWEKNRCKANAIYLVPPAFPSQSWGSHR